MTEGEARKRVLILGTGTAGIRAALELNKTSARVCGLEVTLVDHREYHHPLPFIWHVVSGSLEPRRIVFPLPVLLGKGGREGAVEFRRGRVENIDVDRKVVSIDNGELEWDYLVVALGSTTNYFGMADAEENSLPFRSLGDAVSIHNQILDNYEAASRERDEERQRELLTFVVVGGGPSGIELAAAMQDFMSKALARKHSALAPKARLLLVEAQEALLSGFRPKMSELAMRRLRARGIHLLLGTRITGIRPGGIETADGQTIPSRAVIWAAGVKPVPSVASLPFQKAKDGRVLVNQYLEVPDAPGVYVIGDCAYLLQRGGSRPYPPTHQVAERQGPACARNIMNAMGGKGQRAFRYRFKGQVIYMGRNLAVVELGDLVFDGFTAALLRRVFYLWRFVSYLGLPTELRRKLGAVRKWIPAYFYRRNTAYLHE
ncbi:MAG: NAD(P)/FAD-dependent oxidoreductase [Dehalococcoidia bacterium]|nr:NAD(P)/FAD-dependent oxidoreductase [Dehalococcoidia bacterium]